jgi:hypothetical protein
VTNVVTTPLAAAIITEIPAATARHIRATPSHASVAPPYMMKQDVGSSLY